MVIQRLLLALAVVLPLMARGQALALRTDLWCPYSCEPTAKAQGYFVDLVRAALPQAEIHYQLGRWTELRRQSSTPPGPVLLLLGVSDTEANRRDLLLVQPPIAQGLTCAFRRAEHDWWLKSVADLRGQRLGVTLGYLYHPEVDALLANPATRRRITQVSGERAALAHARMLILGRVDVALEDRQVMRWGLSQLDETARTQVVEAGCLPPQAIDAMHLGLPRADPRSAAIAQALGEGLRRLQGSAELSKLRQQYGLPP